MPVAFLTAERCRRYVAAAVSRLPLSSGRRREGLIGHAQELTARLSVSDPAAAHSHQ